MKMALPFKPNAQNFSILMGLNMGAQLLCNTYSKAVVTQIEQRYGLSSTITGSLVASKTIGGIVCLVILSMYSQNIKNRPRTIALASCIAILGALIAPLPHLLGGKYNPGVTSNSFDSANIGQNVSDFDNTDIIGWAIFALRSSLLHRNFAKHDIGPSYFNFAVQFRFFENFAFKKPSNRPKILPKIRCNW
jgi:hypothetical protein